MSEERRGRCALVIGLFQQTPRDDRSLPAVNALYAYGVPLKTEDFPADFPCDPGAFVL